MSAEERTAHPSRLEPFDVMALLANHPPRTNINVFYVDGAYALRIARVRDQFPTHRHPNGDEGWLILQGRIRIDSELGSVELGVGQGVLVPKGIVHSPTCLEEDSVVAVFNVQGLEIDAVEPGALAASEFVEWDRGAIPSDESAK